MIETFFKNPCNIYFSLWCLYALQGSLYPEGSIISRGLMGIIMIISIIPFFRTLMGKKESSYFKALVTLIVMYIIYGTYRLFEPASAFNHAVMPFAYLKMYMMSLLPIIVCYNYAKEGYLNCKMLKKWVVFFFIVAIADYFEYQRDAILLTNDEEITNNACYIILALIPALFVYNKRPVFKYLGIGVCVFFVISGMKRGAILILALLVGMIIYHDLKDTRGRKKLMILVLVVAGILFMSHVVSNLMSTSAYFNYRIEQTIAGDTSNRDYIYSNFIDAYFNDANVFQLLFGRGADGTLKIHGYAHQDWLETLTNQGLLGIIIFLWYWVSFWRETKNKSRCEESSFVLLLLFILLGTMTMFSMSIGDMNIYSTSMLGFSLADGFAIKDSHD